MGNCRGSICFSFNGGFLIIEFSNRVGSILENQKLEKRIAITPEIIKKYLSLGFEVLLCEIMGHIWY